MAFDECTPRRCRLRLCEKVVLSSRSAGWKDAWTGSTKPKACTDQSKRCFPLCKDVCIPTFVAAQQKKCGFVWSGWKCHWRTGRGRAHGKNVRNGGTGQRDPAQGQTTLSDGSRYSGQSSGGYRARCRHVWLYHAYAKRPKRTNFTKNGHSEHAERTVERRIFLPSKRQVPHNVDTLYSKAYLRHLINTNEILGLQIASVHNLLRLHLAHAGSP